MFKTMQLNRGKGRFKAGKSTNRRSLGAAWAIAAHWFPAAKCQLFLQKQKKQEHQKRVFKSIQLNRGEGQVQGWGKFKRRSLGAAWAIAAHWFPTAKC